MPKIVGREEAPLNKISWVPSEGNFPMKNILSGNRLAGIIALLIGSGWICLFKNQILEALSSGRIFPDLIMVAFITLPGVFVILYGFSQQVYFEETTIDQNNVLWKRRGLFGNHQWREAISNYRGVLKEHQHCSPTDSSRTSYMVYSIRLVHDDSKKDVVLYRAESSMFTPPTDWVDKWKRYAELLKLPVLEKTENGMMSYDASDLNEPLVNKIREGKLKVIPINPLEVKLGLMAKVERDDDLWIINCYPVWNIWKSIAGMIIVIAALWGTYTYGLINPQLFKYFLLFVPVCILAIGFSIRKHLAHPEQLALDKRYIYYRYRNKQKKWVTDDMPLNSIYNISVKPNPMHFRSAGDICIEGKNRTIRFGWWLPKKTKLQIRDLVLSIIANYIIAV